MPHFDRGKAADVIGTALPPSVGVTSLRRIAAALNKRGIPTASGRGKQRSGAPTRVIIDVDSVSQVVNFDLFVISRQFCN
jgi:hypothetical protein